MAIGTQLTLAGARLLSKAMQGKQLLFTRGAFGDAKVNGQLVDPTQEQKDSLTALIHEKMSLPIYYYEFGDDGDLIVAVKVKNNNLSSNFKAAEAGLFAQDPDTGAEVLYGYCYDGNDGDMIHAKSSYCVLEYYVEFVTTIGNATNVSCVINIKEKIKAGDGLSRAGDTLNVNTGVGIGISQYNNVYLKRATDTEKGGAIITGNDGLRMDGETLKAAVGTGISISSAGNIYLKRASDTEKGGAIITGNDGLRMDGETLKAAVGTGISISSAGNIYLKRATDTEKGGVIITGNDGLYMDGETLKADGGDFEGRVKQLEINQSNLFMVLNANNILGVTANLLLVEDFVKCDCTDTSKSSFTLRENDIFYHYLMDRDNLNTLSLAKIGRYYTLRLYDKEAEILITNILDTPDGSTLSTTPGTIYYFSGDIDGWHDFMTEQYPQKDFILQVYRTTAGIVKGKYAYGPGDLTHGTLYFTWDGSAKTTTDSKMLLTTAGYAGRFDLSGDYGFTSDGYFTIE